MSVIILLYYY